MHKNDQHKFVYKASPESWADEFWAKHEALHWLPEEVSLTNDILDWTTKATEADKSFVKQILLFFTQADIEVGCTYIDSYLPRYNDMPIRNMLMGFAAREIIHTKAYAHLTDTLALGDGVYSEFLKDEHLMGIHELMRKYEGRTDIFGQYKNFVMTTAFGEGVFLFGQFAMLLNFARQGLFSGMTQINSWSTRDEQMHVEGIMELVRRDKEFKTLSIKDRRDAFMRVESRLMPLVKGFAGKCFDMGQPKGITFSEVNDFLDYQVARRYEQLGLGENEKKNPLPWFDILVNGTEHASFFETRVTAYSKGALTGKYVY